MLVSPHLQRQADQEFKVQGQPELLETLSLKKNALNAFDLANTPT